MFGSANQTQEYQILTSKQSSAFGKLQCFQNFSMTLKHTGRWRTKSQIEAFCHPRSCIITAQAVRVFRMVSDHIHDLVLSLTCPPLKDTKNPRFLKQQDVDAIRPCPPGSRSQEMTMVTPRKSGFVAWWTPSRRPRWTLHSNRPLNPPVLQPRCEAGRTSVA